MRAEIKHSKCELTTTGAACFQSVARRRARAKIDCLKPHPLQGTYYATSATAKIEALAADMKRNGLLHPIIVMPSNNKAQLLGNTIIDGHDRVAAAKLLGWTEIEVQILDDLKHADASEVEETYLAINLTRKHLDRLDQARPMRRLFEIEKSRKPGTLRECEQREARDRVGQLLGMSGKNLQRYWNVLNAPLEIQRAFQAGLIKLDFAARIGLLKSDKQAKLVRAIESVSDGKAMKRIVEEALGIDATFRHRRVADAVAAFARAVDAGIRDLEGRLDEVRPRLARSYSPILERTARLTEALLAIAAQAGNSARE